MTSIRAADDISANGSAVICALVLATPRNGLLALIPTTRLIRSRLTPKCVSAATTTWASTCPAVSPRSGEIAAEATTAAMARTEPL